MIPTEVETQYTMDCTKCYLCDHEFSDDEEPLFIFNKRQCSATDDACPLSTILSLALDKEVDARTVHSNLLCKACNDTVFEYEITVKRLCEIRFRMLSNYNRTLIKNDLNPLPDFETVEGACSSTSDSTIDKDIVLDENMSSKQQNTIAKNKKDKEEEEPPEIAKDNLPKTIDSNSIKHVLRVRAQPTVQKQTISETRYFKCDYCGDLFKSKKSMTRHTYMHTGAKSYPCLYCDTSFTRSDHRKLHMFRCKVKSSAGKNVKRNSKSNRQSKKHKSGDYKKSASRNGQKSVSDVSARNGNCKITSETVLDDKIATNKNDENLISAAKDNSGSETIVARTKYGEFKCDHCERLFKSKYSMLRHINSLTAERKYQCTYCERSFARSDNMKAHMYLCKEKPSAGVSNSLKQWLIK